MGDTDMEAHKRKSSKGKQEKTEKGQKQQHSSATVCPQPERLCIGGSDDDHPSALRLSDNMKNRRPSNAFAEVSDFEAKAGADSVPINVAPALKESDEASDQENDGQDEVETPEAAAPPGWVHEDKDGGHHGAQKCEQEVQYPTNVP